MPRIAIMRFTKMHGAGNDFICVNCLDEPTPQNPTELARRISDRHFGVGGDGLILICPSAVAEARMTFVPRRKSGRASDV